MPGRAPRAGGKTAVVFGKLLEKFRITKPWNTRRRTSLDQLSLALEGLGVTISRGSLHRYEKQGRIPDVAVIDGLAHLYQLERERLSDAILLDLRVGGLTIETLELVATGEIDQSTINLVGDANLLGSMAARMRKTGKASQLQAEASHVAAPGVFVVEPSTVEGFGKVEAELSRLVKILKHAGRGSRSQATIPTRDDSSQAPSERADSGANVRSDR